MKKILFISLIILFSLMILGASIYLIIYTSSNKKSNEIFDNLRDIYNDVGIDETSNISIVDSTSEPEEIEEPTSNSGGSSSGGYYYNNKSKNLQALLDLNQYFVGWLSIDGTYLDYPVVQTKFDEQYYIHKNFYGQYSFSGVPFCSARSDVETPSDNIVIYSHNMLDGSMFGVLERYSNENFYKQHKYIKFNTIYNGECEYEIVSVFKSDITKEPYPFYGFVGGPQLSFDRFVNFIKEKSIYNITTDIKYGDKFITLITCTSQFGGSGENYPGRYVVVAKQISGKNINPENTLTNDENSDEEQSTTEENSN